MDAMPETTVGAVEPVPDQARALFRHSYRKMRLAGQFFHAQGLCSSPSPQAALRLVTRMIRAGHPPQNFPQFLRQLDRQ